MRIIGGWVWAGVVTAMAGLYLLAIPASGFSHLNLGDALCVGSAVMFAFHIIVVGRYSHRFPVGALSFVQIGLTGVLALCAVPLVSAAGLEAPHFAWNGHLAFSLGITAIGCTVLAFSGQVWAQRHTTPTHAAILFTLEPVFAAITSYIVLGERLGPRALSGAVLIFVAILLAELKGPVQAPPDSEGGESGEWR
jgi:drug/metabolite transporter (DMT)-like permease